MADARLLEELEKLATRPYILIMGDFNASHIDWSSTHANSSEETFDWSFLNTAPKVREDQQATTALIDEVLRLPPLGSTSVHTTVTHPDANERVKQFHRQLKASLRAADDPDSWTDHLTLSLLGISSSRKLDLDCSIAELVFGVTDRLLSEMISPTPRVAVEDPANILHRLRQFTRTPPPVPPRPSISKSYFG
nr:unnamed protein product [Spirometra erinaceieuropaei]